VKCAISMYSVNKYYQQGDMNVLDFVDFAAGIGADGVELLDMYWQDEDTEKPQVRQRVQEHGLTVGCYSTSNDFANPDPQVRAAGVDNIRRACENALYFGAPVVRVFAGNLAEGRDYAEARDWIVAGLQEAAAFAEQRGVRLALENHGLIAGKGRQVKELIEAVASPYLGSTFDAGNFLLVEDTPEEAIHELLPNIYHVHFKDFREAPDDYEGHTFAGLGGIRLVGTIAGEGKVNLDYILRTLHRAGYDGWLAVEFEGPEEPKYGTEQSLKNMRRVIASL